MISATHLHAMLIHFPIALLLAGFFSESLALVLKNDFFKKTAYFLLILGTIGAISAFITGNLAGSGIEEGPLLIPMELHETAGGFTLILSVFTSLIYSIVLFTKEVKPWLKWFGFILFLFLTVAIMRTGYLGGQLVYSHGAGVELLLPDFSN
jgi:uncharacterized membrane protein